ncbi:MAG: ABC transporter permease, partial [Planctomycetota bacterium]
DEKFRPPTWTARSARDPETGLPLDLVGKELAGGLAPAEVAIEVRAGEPGLNAASRHPLGTDESGRDVLSRMIWGGRVSLSVGILSAALLTIIGVIIGSLAGYFGGWVDIGIMRGIEILQSIPAFFLILLALAFTDPETVPPMFAIVLVIAIVRWTGVARLVRGEFLRLREQEFVVASQALGFTSRRTIFRHVLPNAMSPVLVAAAFSVAAGILTESAVSFLGFGIREPDASWGGIVNASRNPENWWIQIFPGVAIFVTVTCYNLVGDAIRDAMDPKMKV